MSDTPESGKNGNPASDDAADTGAKNGAGNRVGRLSGGTHP